MKIHIVSIPININSGFGIVAKNIALGLKELNHEVTVSGLKQADVSEFYYGIEHLPLLGTSADELTQLLLNIQKVNPDVIIFILQSDSGEWSNHVMIGFQAERLLNKKIKCYFYTPVESRGLAYNSINALKRFVELGGTIVAQCNYGHNEMKKEGIDSKIIYHGVDLSLYKPIDLKNKDSYKYCYYNTDIGQMMSDQRLLCERECYDCFFHSHSDYQNCPFYREEEINFLRYFDNPNPPNPPTWGLQKVKISDVYNQDKGKFIYLVVAQNIGVRKHIERAMNAYSILIHNNRQLQDRTMLYLHTIPLKSDPISRGLNLLDITDKLGIQKNVVFTGGDYGSNLTDECMNVLYNKADCHVSSSSGEGYGISSNYSMAVKLPTIGPRNTSFIELIEEETVINGNNIGPRGILCKGEYNTIIDGSERFLIDTQDLSYKMKLIHDDKKLYDMYKGHCLEFVKNLSWQKIVGQWDELIKC